MSVQARQQSYLEHGATFVDRLRTRLVCRKVLSRLPRAQGLRVLDIGCGYHATFLRSLGSALTEGVGIDSSISEESLRDSRLRFFIGPVETQLPQQPDNAFDAVLLISVLEHLWEAESCIRHCHRVLREGGVLVIHVPTWWAKPVLEFSAYKLGTSPACEMDDHKTYYSKRELWPILVKAGFKPSRIRLKYTSFWMTLLATATK